MQVRALALILAPAALFAAPIDFARDVQPVLQKTCLGCHGAKSQMAGLRIAAVRPSRRSPAIWLLAP